MKNKKLQRLLIKLIEKDQEMRKNFQSGKSKWNEKIDKISTDKLKYVIKENGWPTISMVGEEGSRCAWLIVQHSPDLKFQEYCLSLMESLPENEIAKKHIAYLKDRILVQKKGKQIYGTQMKKNKRGKLEPLPIKNMKKVDKLRNEIGLDSLEDYLNRSNSSIL